MMDIISLNGTIRNLSEEPELLNRAMLFGDGFFESFRMCNSKISFWDHHAARIHKAAEILKLEIDETFINALEKDVKTLSEKAGIADACRGRITVYRKGTGLYLPDTNEAEYLIQLFTIPEKEYQLNSQGLIVELFNGLQKPINILSGFKTLNSLPFVLASLERKERKLDELFILNTANRLCESITSNLFIVKSEQLLTPAESEGCVTGVMRSVVLKYAPEFGFSVKETSLTTLDLFEADEVFITNAARGVQWVMGFRNKRYFSKVSENLVSMLNKLVQ